MKSDGWLIIEIRKERFMQIIPDYTWVGFHPLYNPTNQGCFHCSDELLEVEGDTVTLPDDIAPEHFEFLVLPGKENMGKRGFSIFCNV